MLAALAPGQSLIKDRTAARHVTFTVQALRALGTTIESSGPGWKVTGGGGFSPTVDEVSVGSSGTTLYFLIGLAALGDRPVTIVGQRYFRRRPIGPLLRALKRMGVRLEYEGQHLPVTVYPGGLAAGGSGSTARCRSGSRACSMLAPYALKSRRSSRSGGELNERPYLELTLDMMREFGLEVTAREDWREFYVTPNQTPEADRRHAAARHRLGRVRPGRMHPAPVQGRPSTAPR